MDLCYNGFTTTDMSTFCIPMWIFYLVPTVGKIFFMFVLFCYASNLTKNV